MSLGRNKKGGKRPRVVLGELPSPLDLQDHFEGPQSSNYLMAVDADEIIRKKSQEYTQIPAISEEAVALFSLVQTKKRQDLTYTDYFIGLLALMTSIISSMYSYTFSLTFFTLGTTPFWINFAVFTASVALAFNVAVGIKSVIAAVENLKLRINSYYDSNGLLFDSLWKDMFMVNAAIASAVPNVIFFSMALASSGYSPFWAGFMGIIVGIVLTAQSYRGIINYLGENDEDESHAREFRRRLIILYAGMMTNTLRAQHILDNIDALSEGRLTKEETSWLGWGIGGFFAIYTAFYAFCFYKAVSTHNFVALLPTSLLSLAPHVAALTLAVACIAGALKWMLLGTANRKLYSVLPWEKQTTILKGNDVVPLWYKYLATLITISLVWFSVGAACQIVMLYMPSALATLPYAKWIAYGVATPACLGINGVDLYNFLLSAYVFLYERYLEYFPNEKFDYYFGKNMDEFVEKLIINDVVKLSTREILIRNSHRDSAQYEGSASIYGEDKGIFAVKRAATGKLKAKERAENPYPLLKSTMVEQYKKGTAKLPESMRFFSKSQLNAVGEMPNVPRNKQDSGSIDESSKGPQPLSNLHVPQTACIF